MANTPPSEAAAFPRPPSSIWSLKLLIVTCYLWSMSSSSPGGLARGCFSILTLTEWGPGTLGLRLWTDMDEQSLRLPVVDLHQQQEPRMEMLLN